MNDKIPRALKEKQELTRQQTINSVIKAIHELLDQGYVIKIKSLMEYTGLSRSTFGKSHVREVLERYDVVEKKIETEAEDVMVTESIEKRLRIKIECKDRSIKKLIRENKELKQECELLRGRLYISMQRDV